MCNPLQGPCDDGQNRFFKFLTFHVYIHMNCLQHERQCCIRYKLKPKAIASWCFFCSCSSHFLRISSFHASFSFFSRTASSSRFLIASKHLQPFVVSGITPSLPRYACPDPTIIAKYICGNRVGVCRHSHLAQFHKLF